MYKLWHKLFGWDYIAWENSADNGIARVRTSGDGTLYYFRYRCAQVIDLIESPEQIKLWLTCSADKYFSKDVA